MYSSFVLFALLKKQQANASGSGSGYSRQEQDTSVGASLACVGAAVLVSRLVGWLLHHKFHLHFQMSKVFPRLTMVCGCDGGRIRS